MRYFLFALLLAAASTFADASQMNGGPVTLYDSAGNGITSTTNWLNVDIQNASIPVSQSGTWNINNITGTVSLPTGAATAALQSNVQSAVGTSATTAITVQGSATGVAIPISAASLPLPTGASTSANQSTEITSLGTIVTNTGNTNTSVQNTQGSVAPGTAASKSDLVGGVYTSGGVTLTTGQQAALQLNSSGQLQTTTNLTQVGGSAIALGQTTMSASVPVTIASNQSMIPVTPGNPTIATYVVNITGISPAASPTDVVTITGSASHIVRIMSVRLLGSQTLGSVKEIDLIKRTTLDTGGTSSPQTAAQMDSGDSAPTSVVSLYTANPTSLGTSAGKIVADLVFVPDVVTQLFLEQFSNYGNQKPVVLENANENLAVNLGGSTMTGGNLALQIIWTEL